MNLHAPKQADLLNDKDCDTQNDARKDSRNDDEGESQATNKVANLEITDQEVNTINYKANLFISYILVYAKFNEETK